MCSPNVIPRVGGIVLLEVRVCITQITVMGMNVNLEISPSQQVRGTYTSPLSGLTLAKESVQRVRTNPIAKLGTKMLTENMGDMLSRDILRLEITTIDAL